MRRLPLLAIAASFLLAPVAHAGFALNDTAGQHLDVLLDGKIVARYMYAHDTSSKERHDQTYKPFLHVFDAEGKAPITNGAGAKQFPHHRGIYIGWNKISAGGKSYDRWHMKGGDIAHQKFTAQTADADTATVTSVTRWDGASADKPIIEEERTFTFRRAPAPARVTIDVASKLTAVGTDVTLDGDPEHAGIHYRPAPDINVKETTYVFPKAAADPKVDRDYAWVGLTYTLGQQQHSVVHINHPENPKDTRYSAYRDYGRFGAFPVLKIPAGQSATVKYRFLIASGQMPPADVIQKVADQFTGATTPSPVPALTVKGGSVKAAPKPKPAAAAK